MPHCKAFGCSNEQGKSKNPDGSHKSFFKFPNPEKSKRSRVLCRKWLERLKNVKLPRRLHEYTWCRSHVVCEDHFTLDCFEGLYANDVAASLGFKPSRKLLKDGAVPTVVDVMCANAKDVAVRQDTTSWGKATSGAHLSQERYKKLSEKRQAAQRKANLLLLASNLRPRPQPEQPPLLSKKLCNKTTSSSKKRKKRAVHSDKDLVSVGTSTDLFTLELKDSVTSPVLSCGHVCITCLQQLNLTSSYILKDHQYSAFKNTLRKPLKKNT